MYPNNFLTLWKQRELNEQRVIPLIEIARDTGVHMTTLRGLRDKVIRQPYRATLSSLSDYFGVKPDQIMGERIRIADKVWLREQSGD